MRDKTAVLLGKGDLAIKIGELLKSDYNLICVPDKPEPSWTKSLTDWCDLSSINFVDSGRYEDVDSDSIDLAVSVFYGTIIKESFINKCDKIINLHNAPLPKYRGVRPINWALKNNEIEHGVTIHKISKGVDDGDILGQVKFNIYPEIEEVEDVYKKCLTYGFELFKDVYSKLPFVYDNAFQQESSIATFYHSRDNKLLGERSDFRRNK